MFSFLFCFRAGGGGGAQIQALRVSSETGDCFTIGMVSGAVWDGLGIPGERPVMFFGSLGLRIVQQLTNHGSGLSV